LAKYPEHPAANHYYIHAVEASDQPGKALPSANRLSVMMPNVSHMVHMPSHTYIRTGNYKQGIDVNTSAINGFYTYSKEYPAVEELAALYLSHNQHMQVACALMQGSYQFAMATAIKTREGIPDAYFAEPSAFNNYLQSIHMVPNIVNLRFGKWEDLLNSPMVNEKTLGFEYAFQLYAKGSAAAYTGKLDKANEYLQKLSESKRLPVLKERYASFANAAYEMLEVSEHLLKGTIAGQQKKWKEAITFYSTAVALEDSLLYNEPKDWLLPARHYLGKALLMSAQFAAAESVYKKDLQVNPNNPWALAGLLQSQLSQNKKEQAAITKNALIKASTNADVIILSSIAE
jgi:tetratricopeptide (TPR) repeat protein